MRYPYRENLEVFENGSDKMIRCNRCFQVLCRLGEDWKETATRRTFSPTHAGVLLNHLEGYYQLEKLYCPSCGVLLESDMLETRNVRSGS